MRIRKTRAVAAAIAAVLTMQVFSSAATLAAPSISDTTTSSVFVPVFKEGSYGEYLQNYTREKTPTAKIDIDILNYEGSDDIQVTSVGGRDNVVVTQESSTISYTFDVPAAGLYAIGLNYYPIEGRGAAIERRVKINGKVLYTEAGSTMLNRYFVDDVENYDDPDNYFAVDTEGGQIRPMQTEIRKWMDDMYFSDSSGVYGTALKFYFEKGTNTITFDSIREPLAYSALWISGYEETQSYDDMLINNAQYSTDGNQLVATVQAEMPSAKSSSSLVAGTDKSSSATVPASTGATKLNIMGSLFGSPTWKNVGEWVEYTVNVPEAGLYKIVLRARQSFKSGVFSSREITVNGERPYEGQSSVQFSYNSSWQFVTPSDEYGEPLLFKFNKGENTIRVKAVYGEMDDIINAVSTVIDKLNGDYRKLLMIIGYSPDPYMDYELEEFVPEVISDLKAQADTLKKIYNEIISITGETGEITAQLSSLYDALYQMYDDPDQIPVLFSALTAHVGTLGQWQADVSEQPLEIDYIMVAEKNYNPGKPENGFFANFGHQIKMFFSSFFTDVNAIASTTDATFDEKAKVWMTSSRDEAQVVRQLIDRTFVSQNEVFIQLDLINGGALLPSILAGIGPDVVLSMGSGEIINNAARGAMEPLENYEGFDELRSWFVDCAFDPLTLKWNDEESHIYGIPTSESIDVLFYRTDVFEELGIEPPKTWDEIYDDVIPLMQKRNMQFNPPTYATLLYQNGGQYYRNNGTYVDIDSAIGISTLLEWTDFYIQYKLPITANFNNRFRYGEMPAGILGLGGYNQMAVFAPEIKGLWSIAELPGKVREDGTVNNVCLYDVGAVVMLAGAKEKANGWKFMKWYAGADTQVSIAKEMESLLGVAGRCYPANTEAIKRLNWTAAELEVILAQRNNIEPTPVYVGTYLMSRYLTMAFNAAVVEAEDPRDTLLDYIKEINDEIIRKREEYGIKVYLD